MKTESHLVKYGMYKNLLLYAGYEHPDTYIFGTYENQLNPYIENAIYKKPNLLINIGCGFGYHGLGIAKFLPDTRCILVDTNEDCLNIAKESSRINSLQNVEFKNTITEEEINNLCKENNLVFFLIDIEGEEESLLNTEKYNTFKNSIFLIECHDFIKPNITKNLCDRFLPTHDVYIIDDRNKVIDSNLLQISKDKDFVNFYSEGRPCNMSWIYTTPKNI